MIIFRCKDQKDKKGKKTQAKCTLYISSKPMCASNDEYFYTPGIKGEKINVSKTP